MFPALNPLQSYHQQLNQGLHLTSSDAYKLLDQKKVFPRYTPDTRGDKADALQAVLDTLSQRAGLATPAIEITDVLAHSQGMAAARAEDTPQGVRQIVAFDVNFFEQSTVGDLANVAAHEISHVALGHTLMDDPEPVKAAKSECHLWGVGSALVAAAVGFTVAHLTKLRPLRAIVATAGAIIGWFSFTSWYQSKARLGTYLRQAEFDADELGVRLMGSKENALDLMRRAVSSKRDDSDLVERHARLKTVDFTGVR